MDQKMDQVVFLLNTIIKSKTIKTDAQDDQV